MAPALKFLGRRWHAATDDFVVPSATGLAVHITLLVICATGLAWLEPNYNGPCATFPDLGEKVDELRGYLAGLIALDAVLLAGLVWLCYCTLQGSVMDGYLRARKLVPVAVNVIMTTYLALLVLNTWGTWVYSHTLRGECMSLTHAAGYTPSALLIIAVFGHWAALGVVATVLVLGFNPFQDNSDVRNWERRCSCLAVVLCCASKASTRAAQMAALVGPPGRGRAPPLGGSKGGAHPTDDGAALEQQLEDLQNTRQLSPIATLAAVFSFFYSHVDLTLSDIATALLLVGMEQQMERRDALHDSPQYNVTVTTGPPGSIPPPRPSGAPAQSPLRSGERMAVGAADAHAGTALLTPFLGDAPHSPLSVQGPASPHVPRDTAGLATAVPEHSAPSAIDPVAARTLDLVQDVPAGPVTLSTLEESHHYFQYALAAYGWPMYVFMSARSRPSMCLKLCPGCCPCCTCNRRRRHPDLAKGMTLQLSKSLTLRAVQELTGLDPDTCLLVLCQKDDVEGLLPYQVTINPHTKELVIAVRGSMSQYDVVTDLICDPAQLPASWLPGQGPCTLRAPTAHHGLEQAGQQGGVDEAAGQPAGAAARPPAQSQLVHRGMLACAQAIVDDMAARRVLSAVLTGDTQGLARLSPAQRELVAWLGTGCDVAGADDASSGAVPAPLQPPAVQVVASVRGRVASELSMRSEDPDDGVCRGPLPPTPANTVVGPSDAAGPDALTTPSTPPAVQTSNSPADSGAVALAVGPGSGTQPSSAGPASPTAKGGVPHTASLAARLSALRPSASLQGLFTGILSRGAAKAAKDNGHAPGTHPLASQPWRVVVVGHSLGAGVAALLALHLRTALQGFDVRCWSFSPPGGLMAPQLSRLMRDYCTSVVIGRDMIPRLSFGCMDKLNRDMLMAAALCKVPKAVFWPLAVMGRTWTRDQLFRSPEHVPEEVWALVQRYGAGLASSESAPRFQAAFNFVMPGTVLYYECLAVSDSEITRDSFAILRDPGRRHSIGDRASAPAASPGPHTGEVGMPPQATRAHAAHTVITVHASAGAAAAEACTVSSVSADSGTPLQARAPPMAGLTTGAGQLPASASLAKSTATQGSGKRSGNAVGWGPSGPAGPRKRFVPRWSSPAEISRGGLLVSRRMFAMHVPDLQNAVLEECLEHAEMGGVA